ncbi:hypothetical protein V6N11_018250 [Hibiscus sabdariffa]|uniref:Uncharacterized protein n=1 Tax=Hibiscus sabdariffa TaxID=183260 RepID=A0ABR2T7G3_9ROSI
MLNSQGTWIWTTFQHHWPLAVLLRIEVVKESDPLFSLDAVGWGLNANHRQHVYSDAGHMFYSNAWFNSGSSWSTLVASTDRVGSI